MIRDLVRLADRPWVGAAAGSDRGPDLAGPDPVVSPLPQSARRTAMG